MKSLGLGLSLLIAGAMLMLVGMPWAGLGVAVVGVVSLVSGGFRRGGEAVHDQLDRVPNEERSRLIPIRKLAREIEELLTSQKGNAIVRALGPEAREDTQRIVAQAVEMVNLRARLQKAAYLIPQVEKAIQEAESAIAAQPDQSAVLQSALIARKLELGHLQRAESGIQTVDAHLTEAAAALSELKSRLMMAAAGKAELGQESMRETLSRMRSLSATFDEAENVLGTSHE